MKHLESNGSGEAATTAAAAVSDLPVTAVGVAEGEIPGLRGANVWDLAVQRAKVTPEAVLAYDERGRVLTFGELPAAAERAAAALSQRGIGRGSVVSWQLATSLETVVLLTALSRLGAVQNPLIMMLREQETRFICAQAGTELLVVPPEFRGFAHGEMAERIAADLPRLEVLLIDGALPEADPSDLPPVSDEPEIRWLFYTSGTTSEPKGAKHTDEGLLAASDAFCNAIRPEPTDRIAGLAPIAHVGGVLLVISALQSGCSLILTDVFEPRATSRLLHELDVTLGGIGVPFANALMAQQRATPDQRLFPHMRAFLMGGAPRPATLHGEVKDTLGGVGTVSGYGLTECPFASWARPTDDERHLALSDGLPGPGTEIRIVGPDESLVAPGETGELRLRAPQLMKGYVDSNLDVAAFDEHGFFRTGDLATVDEEGYVTITGRIKDVIIRNMENISAREVEEHLARCAGVAEVAVVGRPDPVTGEHVCAVVVPRDPGAPPTLESLTADLLEFGLNKRKLPQVLEVVESLPRNAMGKILKRELR